MYVEGTVLNTKGEPIPNAIIDTWESDGDGKYDNQVRSVYSASAYYLHADPFQPHC
jgi:protocatechuate 3,4-dioxygenase beta subunit